MVRLAACVEIRTAYLIQRGFSGNFSGKLELATESFGNLRDTLTGRRAHFTLRAAFAKYEPDSRAIDFFVVADGSSELSDFERAASKFAIENRARFVEKIFESLRGEHRIHVARDGRFEVVIGKLVGDHEFNR